MSSPKPTHNHISLPQPLCQSAETIHARINPTDTNLTSASLEDPTVFSDDDFYDAHEDVPSLQSAKNALIPTQLKDPETNLLPQYKVRNADTGQVYDIRELEDQFQTYSIFPSDFVEPMRHTSQNRNSSLHKLKSKFRKSNKPHSLTPQTQSHPVQKVLGHKKEKRDFEQVQLAQSLPGHCGTIWAMQFSYDGSHLATGGQDTILRVWRVYIFPSDEKQKEHKQILDKEAEQMYSGHCMPIVDLSWSRSNFLLSASMDKTVRLWHVSRAECLHVFQHPDSVPAVDFHPKEDRYFVSGCFDKKARVWDIPDGCVVSYVQTPIMITAARYNPSGTRVIVGLLNGQCIFYQVSLHQQMNYYTQIECRNSRGSMKKGRKVTGIEFDPEGKLFIVSTNDSRMRLFSVDNYSKLCKYKGLLNDHLQIKGRFSQDGDYLICGSENGHVYIWNKQSYLQSMSLLKNNTLDRNASYECFCAAEPPNGIVTVALFAPASTHAMVKAGLDSHTQLYECTGLIVTASYDGCIKLFERVSKNA